MKYFKTYESYKTTPKEWTKELKNSAKSLKKNDRFIIHFDNNAEWANTELIFIKYKKFEGVIIAKDEKGNTYKIGMTQSSEEEEKKTIEKL